MITKLRMAAAAAPMALVLAALATPASAMVPVGTALKDFNAIIFNNASTQSDIEGAAVIGGNFNGATMYSKPSASLPTGFGALTVYGKTTGNGINLNNGGSAYVAGGKGAKINFNGGGSYLNSNPATIAEFETEFMGLSLNLSKLAATSFLPKPGNNEVIKATPGKDGVAVFDITAQDLSNIGSYGYKLELNGASSVIFNVSGSSINFNGNDQSGVTGANNVIWNFFDATKVNLGTQLAGTVLAVQGRCTTTTRSTGPWSPTAGPAMASCTAMASLATCRPARCPNRRPGR